jgi:hypothetical protein
MMKTLKESKTPSEKSLSSGTLLPKSKRKAILKITSLSRKLAKAHMDQSANSK